MAVLERAREERARRRARLELLAVVAEADDDRASVDPPQRVEEDVDALVVEQLPEVEDGRLVARRTSGEPLGVALVGQPLVRVAGVRRIVAPASSSSAASAASRSSRPELLDVDAGRHLVHALDVADDVLEHLADVGGADEDGAARHEALAAQADSSAFPRIEYSSSEPWALTA